MNRVLTVLLLALVGGSVPAAEPVLLMPARERPSAVRLDIGDNPAWSEFLDALFNYFDRDGDRGLRQNEVERLFPLPLTGGRELAFDFVKLDANRDGKVDREELKGYCQRGGFGPLVVTLAAPSGEGLVPGSAIFRQLDANSDGRLSAAELKRTSQLFRIFDENDDERLTPAELLAVPLSAPRVTPEVRLADRPAPSDSAVLRLPEAKNESVRLRAPNGSWELVLTREGPGAGVKDTAEFCRTLFSSIATTAAGATRKLLELDPTTALLVELFDFADRDANGKLTTAELDAYLKLAERGATCQTLLEIQERGRDLFAVLDADSDGQLNLRELNAAAQLPDGLRPGEVPLRAHASVRRGSAGVAFGGLALAPASKTTAPRTAKREKGPRWFDAQDRNGDGLLSLREFVGPPDVFRRLDSDGDGVLNRDEASRAASP